MAIDRVKKISDILTHDAAEEENMDAYSEMLTNELAERFKLD